MQGALSSNVGPSGLTAQPRSLQQARLMRAAFGLGAPRALPGLRVARLRVRSSTSSGMGGGSPPPGGRGGGGGDGWDSSSSPGGEGDSSTRAALLLAGKAALDGLPAEIAAAIRSGHISHEVLARYLDMSKSAFLTWLMKSPYVVGDGDGLFQRGVWWRLCWWEGRGMGLYMLCIDRIYWPFQ